jgi:hypothetical protein
MVGFFRRTAAAASTAFMLGTAALPAQEIGVYYAQGSSELSELGSPSGVGGFIGLRTAPWAGVRLGFHAIDHTSTRLARVCTQYIPPVNCNGSEAATMHTTLRGAYVAGMLHYSPIRPLDFSVGVGGSMNQVRGAEQTVSGRRTDVFMLESAHFGMLVHAGGRIRPLRGVPLALETSLTQHRLVLRGCDGDRIRYDPYCGTYDLREVRVGVGYDMGW